MFHVESFKEECPWVLYSVSATLLCISLGYTGKEIHSGKLGTMPTFTSCWPRVAGTMF